MSPEVAARPPSQRPLRRARRRPLACADTFLGVWDVDSVLRRVELPLGPEFVPDMRVGGRRLAVAAAAQPLARHRCAACPLDCCGLDACRAGASSGAHAPFSTAAAVPVLQVVQRAQQQDLDSVVRYQVAFVANQRGETVPDRAFNTGGRAALLPRAAWAATQPAAPEMLGA